MFKVLVTPSATLTRLRTAGLVLGLALPVLLAAPAHAQYEGVRARLDVEKPFDLGRRWDLTLGQQVQFTPERPGPRQSSPTRGEIDVLDDDFWDEDADDDVEDRDEGDDREEDDLGDDAAASSPDPQRAARRPPLVIRGLRSRTQVDASFRLNRAWRWTSAYAYDLRPGTNTHTLSAGLSYRRRLPGEVLRLKTHLKYQARVRDVAAWETRHQARWKLTLDTRGTVAPYASTEVFYRIEPGESRFNRLRLALGVDVALGSSQQLTLEYRPQRRLGRADAGWQRTLRLGYRYRL